MKKVGKKPQNRKPEERAPDGTFTKGNTGNPGGQPQWRREFAEAFGKRCAPLAEAVLFRVLSGRGKDGKDDPDITTDHQLRAAEDVLMYVVPRPKQEVDVNNTGPGVFAGLTPEQLVAIATGKGQETK